MIPTDGDPDGQALLQRDGSYPIANGGDLTRAIRAYGRANKEDRGKVRRHIIKRARGLGKADRIPKTWLSVSIEEQAADARATFRAVERTPVEITHAELSARVAALKFKGKPEFEEKLHPRNDEGKFREVLFRLKREVEGAPGAEEAAKEIDAADESNKAANDDETKRHIANIMRIVEQVAEGNIDPNTSKTLRDGNRELGRFVAGTTLPDIVDTEKMRWSDLPPLFQSTVDELLAKLEGYVSKETFDKATAELIEFKRGGDVWNASELMASLAKILRYLMGTGNSPEELEQDRQRRADNEEYTGNCLCQRSGVMLTGKLMRSAPARSPRPCSEQLCSDEPPSDERACARVLRQRSFARHPEGQRHG